MYLLAQVLYAVALVGMSLYGLSSEDHLPCYRLVAYFSMIHVAVWATVGMFDRLVGAVDVYVHIQVYLHMYNVYMLHVCAYNVVALFP